jgi:glutathione peroxidase
VVLAFPCNQFGHQENSGGQEILNALRHVRPGNGFEPKCILLDKVGNRRPVLKTKLCSRTGKA